MPVPVPESLDVHDQVASEVEHQLRAVLHEMRQPLAAVFALAEMARTRPGLDESVRGYLDSIIDQAREVAAAAASVLVARPEGGNSSRPVGEGSCVDLDEVVDSVVDAFRLTWTGTLVRTGDRGGHSIPGDRADIRRGLVNVVENAVRAAGAQGRVTIGVHQDGEGIRVAVEDDGPGFGHVAAGTGLGLRLTRKTVSALGGRISIGLPPSVPGTRVVLVFPDASAGPADAPATVGAV